MNIKLNILHKSPTLKTECDMLQSMPIDRDTETQEMPEKLHSSWFYFYMNENEEINTDEILIGNFIHDGSGRNCIYLHMIEHPQYTDY